MVCYRYIVHCIKGGGGGGGDGDDDDDDNDNNNNNNHESKEVQKAILGNAYLLRKVVILK